MSNNSIKERFNNILNKGADRWLTRSLFEEDDHLSRGRSDIEAHRAQGFGREGKPLPAPAIQQRMGSNVEPQEPNVKLDLSRGPQPKGAFQKPEERDYSPGEPQEKFRKILGGNNKLVEAEFARLNSNLDWGNLDSKDPKMLEQVKDYAAHQVFYAHELKNDMGTDNDIDSDEEQDNKKDDKKATLMTYQEIQALKANEKRNLALYGHNIESGEFEGRPDPKQTKMLVDSTRPFKFGDDFIETTYNIMRQMMKAKDGFGRIGSVDKSDKNIPEAAVKDLLSVINQDVKGEDDKPITATELKKIFASMVPGAGGYQRPEREYFKGNRSDEERPDSARLQRVHDLVEIAMRHDSLGDEIRREPGDSGSQHEDRRSRYLWKLYLEQGGREALTGLPLDTKNMVLEHVAGVSRSDVQKGENEIDRMMDTDTDENYVLLNNAINGSKGGKDLETFYANNVRPLYDITPDQFGQIEGLRSQAQGQVDNFMNDVIGTHLAGGEFKDSESAMEVLNQIQELRNRIGGISEQVFDNLEEKPSAPRSPTRVNPNSRQFRQTTPKGKLATALKHRDDPSKTLNDTQLALIDEWENTTIPENERRSLALQQAQQQFTTDQETFDNFDEDDFNERLNGYNERKDFYNEQGKKKIDGESKNISKRILKEGFGLGVGGHQKGVASFNFGQKLLDEVLENLLQNSDSLEEKKGIYNDAKEKMGHGAKLWGNNVGGNLENEDLEEYNGILSSIGENNPSMQMFAKKYMRHLLENGGFF